MVTRIPRTGWPLFHYRHILAEITTASGKGQPWGESFCLSLFLGTLTRAEPDKTSKSHFIAEQGLQKGKEIILAESVVSLKDI